MTRALLILAGLLTCLSVAGYVSGRAEIDALHARLNTAQMDAASARKAQAIAEDKLAHAPAYAKLSAIEAALDCKPTKSAARE